MELRWGAVGQQLWRVNRADIGVFRGAHGSERISTWGELAEGVGFEPTVPVKGTTVFETAPIDRSGTPPLMRAKHLARPGTSRKLELAPNWHRATRSPFRARSYRRFDGLGRSFIGVAESVGIDVQSRGRAPVAQAPADGEHVDLGRDQGAGVRVAQAVECNLGQLEGGDR